MIDGHVHLEKGPLTVEYAMQFVEEAQRKGITTLQILDHSHRFVEFAPLYEELRFNLSQQAWLSTDLRNSLTEYYDLIRQMRAMELPIDVRFGLEVCYISKKEDFLKTILPTLPLDFLIGSVHHVFNLAYDSSWSMKDLWQQYPTDEIYKEYFNENFALIKSGLFDQIGHPDTIKMFNIEPSFDCAPYYRKIAELANEYHVKVENNTGCYYRYNHPDMGLNDSVLAIFKEEKCDMITVSDAHRPQDVGNYIAQIWVKTMK